MSIQYGVVLNKLTQPHSFMCQTVGRDTVEEKELAGFIHDKHPTITQEMAQTILDAFGAITYEELLKGNGVTLTNFLRFDLTIRGKMKLPTDLIRKGNIQINAIPAKEFQDDFRFITNIGPRIPIPLIKLPVITTMRDSNSALPNWFRANHPMIVDGENLGIDRNDTDQGLFLTSPAGNVTEASLQLIGNKRLVGIPTLDETAQPAGTNSVAYTVQAKAKYTPDGDLRSSNIYGYARTTNKVDESNPYVYVDGNAATSPATASYAGDAVTVRLLATFRPDNILRVSAGLANGTMGIEVAIFANGIFGIPVPGLPTGITLAVGDRIALIQTVLSYQRYLMEVLEIGASTPPIPVFDAIDYKTPDYIYDTFADLNPHGRYFGSIADGWYTASSRRPAGDFKYTQIYVGRNYATEGQIGYDGSTILEQEVGGSLSLNTYGVISIGNGKIARYMSGTVSGGEWVVPSGWGVFNLDPAASTATLIDDNRDFYGPYGDNEPMPGGQWDVNIYSNGTVYYLSNPRPDPPETADSCSRFSLSNTTGEATNLQTITEIFGTDRVTWFNPSSGAEWGMRAGKALDSGGAIWTNRTNNSATIADKKMDFLTILGGSRIVSNCPDTDGCPLAVATNSSVFATCYLAALHSEDNFTQPQGLIRIRCGTLDGIIPTFGAGLDLYAGLNTFVPVPADMIHLGGEYYILVVGNMDGGTTDFFLLKTDGETITVENTMTMGATAWYQPIMLAPSGYSDYVLCHVLGVTGSTSFTSNNRRYVFTVGDFETIPLVEGSNTVFTEWERDAAWVDRLLTVPAGLTSMTIAFPDESINGAELIMQVGKRAALPADYYHQLKDWADNTVTIPSPDAGPWWFMVKTYGADGTTISVTFTP